MSEGNTTVVLFEGRRITVRVGARGWVEERRGNDTFGYRWSDVVFCDPDFAAQLRDPVQVLNPDGTVRLTR